MIISFLCMLLYSCGAKKGVRYFENIDKSQLYTKSAANKVVYRSDDRMIIRISSPDNIGAAAFNKNETESYKSNDGNTTTSTSSVPYIVNDEGNIEFPTLGLIEVAGKTKKELTDLLKERLKMYINEPWVDIELLTFRVSVMGEVGTPGRVTVEDEQINILEALALAGDLNITAKREDIQILRDVNGKMKFIQINLLDEGVFRSEGFYLKPDDIVYVPPVDLKTREIGWETSLLRYTGIAAFALSVYTILSR